MHRFFSEEPVIDNTVKIYGDDFKHIKKVLRIADDEKIEVVVDRKVYNGYTKICDDYVLVYELEEMNENTELNTNIHLLQSVVKGDKIDFIIQKTVELGACDITLINAKRCVAKIDSKKEKNKFERYNKISYEASKQSKRLIVPEVKGIVNLKECKKYINENSVLLIAYENDRDISLKEVINDIKNKNVKDIYVLIGPEGGFEKEEVDYLVDNGALSVGLGSRILRTETAGLNLLSILQYEFN